MQQRALESVLDEVGWVRRVLCNKRTGHVIDGHLRVLAAMDRQEPTVPVDYVDVSEGDERALLATLDPIAAMAGTDRDQLGTLIADVSRNGAAALAETLKRIGEDFNVDAFVRKVEFAAVDGNLKTDHRCPKCGYEWSGTA